MVQSFRTLKLDRVGRAFGTMNALRDVSFEVNRGEFVALLGPSGCGKSTALNCIAGLLPTTSGSIWLDDRRIDTLSPEERGFGMVFQNYALFPHMTVRDNVGFGLKMKNRPKDEIARKVNQALATVRLESQADKLPGQMSGGQQQRVAIARAIAIEPPLVLMDEPLSNLDAKLRLEMRQEIRRIHQGLGSITIYVTHDQDEALSLADRIVVLRDGMIRQIGAPSDLYQRPDFLDVADFMGFRNRVRGRVVARDGDRVTLDIGGATITGVARATIGEEGVAAIRPDDLVAAADGVPATTDIIEYRGRHFFGQASGPGGAELFFRSSQALAPGEKIHLAAPADRVLMYPADAAKGARS